MAGTEGKRSKVPQNKEKQEPAEQRSEGKRRGSSYSEVVSTLITSSPAWIRGIVLLLLCGGVLTVVVTVCAAIFAGREVTSWPPKIAAYVPPEVRNCSALIEALPDIRKSEEQEINRIGVVASNYFEQLMKFRNDYASKEGNGYVNSAANLLKGDLDELNKRLDAALEKLRKRNDDVVAGCLTLGASDRAKAPSGSR